MSNNGILLIIVLILLLAVVALNFNKFKTTGKVQSGDILININPKTVNCGRYDNSKVINIFADAGSVGLDTKFYMHKKEGTRVGTSSDNLCKPSICTGLHSKNYRIGCELNSGEYFFRFSRDNYDITVDSPSFQITHTS